MATKIAFMAWTDQGLKSFRETVDRLELARRLAERYDVEIEHVWWTVGGPYDLVAVVEARDPVKYSAFGLALQALGNLRVVAADAYGPEEMLAVIDATG